MIDPYTDRVKRNSQRSNVYFIKPVGLSGPIKIGVSGQPEERLKTLMAWSPLPLEMIVIVSGTHQLEQRIHDCFAYAHLHREWFSPVHDLVLGIENLLNGKPIEEAFDLSKPTGSIRKRNPNLLARWTPAYRERRGYEARVRNAERKLHNLRGVYFGPPDDVDEIVRVNYPGNLVPLTNSQRARLDEVLAHPERYFTP